MHSLIITITVNLSFSRPVACESVSWIGQLMMSGKVILWVFVQKILEYIAEFHVHAWGP